MPRTTNVRAGLLIRGTLGLTDLGLRYYANERSTGFVYVYDDRRVTDRVAITAMVGLSGGDE
jgi:hypothetical protein